MDKTTYAYWLADKIASQGDYAKEGAEVLKRQADEIDKMHDALIAIKRHMEIVSPNGCKLSAVYAIATKGLCDA